MPAAMASLACDSCTEETEAGRSRGLINQLYLLGELQTKEGACLKV